MKKTVKEIDDLTTSGWKIKDQDRNMILAQLRSNQAAAAIVVSLEDIKTAIGAKDDSIQMLLNNHYKLIYDLILSFNRQKKFEFDVKRNKNGFIDKVIVEEIE